MGSTHGHTDNDTHSINVAHNLVERGFFEKAQQELKLVTTPCIDVDVLNAICEYRLGDESALERVEKQYGNKLTDDHIAQMFRHEILGHLSAKPRRFAQAIDTLQAEEDGKRYDDLTLLWKALQVLQDGQRSSRARIGHRHYRAGMTAPAYKRAQYLNDAFKYCALVNDDYSQSEAEPDLIRVVTAYLMLLIEMSMSAGVRDNPHIRRLRRELYSVDEGIRHSLPPYLFFRFAQYRTTFA